MAKKNQTPELVATDAEALAVASETKGKGRKVMLTDPATGGEVARADVIRANFEAGMSRGDIVKLLKEKYAHEVAYQIVFAATKTAPTKDQLPQIGEEVTEEAAAE